ncbi:MAG: VOC family protein [Rhizobium sp.]|jgi:catechol 2,3-dioxygenase-like lactoylglutathione lyase family enzyme|nr:VOC family protein [Rhizobium sp.]
MTTQSLFLVALVVPDYDAAIAFYCGALGFTLVEDNGLEGDKRWVVIRPPGGEGASLLLAKAADEEQARAIGMQAGGRVGFFLKTDDFARDHAAYTARGVVFEEAPRHEVYGTVAVFRDPFGNRWDLIQHAI